MLVWGVNYMVTLWVLEWRRGVGSGTVLHEVVKKASAKREGFCGQVTFERGWVGEWVPGRRVFQAEGLASAKALEEKCA